MITAREIAAALRPALIRAPAVGPMRFRHAVVDSRKAGRGDLFVALKGEHADGHDFVADAARRGATGAIVERPVDAEIAQYVVRSALAALQELARRRRLERTRLKVVGITGSVGKTTTKELTAAVLAARYPLLKSEGNLNSEIGLPMVLLELSTRHRRAVLEMGMWAPGEIALLCEIARPDTGIVTTVGPSHLERMGTMEAIEKEKGDLPAALPEDGIAILNADDPRVARMAQRTVARVVTYGLSDAADVRASGVESRGLEGVSFTLLHEGRRARVRMSLPGAALVPNALAAAAAGLTDGIEIGDVAHALSEARVPLRMKAHRGINGSTILDDSYNASPASMRAALDLLAEVPGRKIAVLGDMRELGSAEREGHGEVGRRAAEVADRIYAIGELGRWIGDAAIQAGHADVRIVRTKEEAEDDLAVTLREGDVVLLKASRALALESMLERLAVPE